MAGNEADSGGALWSWGAVTIVNSTFAQNTAFDRGGALGVTGTTLVIGSTLAGNTGADGSAIHRFSTGPANIQLVGSIISGPADLCTGHPELIASGGYNIASDATCHLDAGTDLPSTDPVLGALADNGGPTPSALPGPTSPAIDAIPVGTPDLCPALGTDQRGVTRPVGTACDIGAVEQ